MTKDGEIPAIFNPKRVRTPSVVVTGDSPNGPYGGFTNIIEANNPSQLTQQDSLTSSHGGNEPNENTGNTQPLQMTPSGGVGGCLPIEQNTQITPRTGGGTAPSENDDFESPGTEIPQSPNVHIRRLRACKESCCSELAQKMYFGVCVTILVTASWVGATHCIKFLYLNVFRTPTIEPTTRDSEKTSSVLTSEIDERGGSNEDNSTSGFLLTHQLGQLKTTASVFNAPFFASWFCTNFCFFFFPIYILGRISVRKCDKPGEILGDVLRGFRDRGFTIGRFLNRCITFCILWVLTTYLYAMSLRSLLATDVLALFATNVACVYLLSWVILHEQFVGVRIVAVILCDTGIALLAYMDGITGSPTLAGVVLSALAAAGYAVFKVMFRKVMGDPPIGQIAFTFSMLGFLNATLLWPVCVGLYLTGTEVMPFDRLPWIILLIASILLLVFHILTQFSAAVTYNMFVTLGLITAVPVSGALDVILYSATFAGMKLAGVILIAVGFFLVMFPENWPDYITRLLRNIILLGHNASFRTYTYNRGYEYIYIPSSNEVGEEM
ncbi:putative thiamine transporter SLC35F3 isoform X3 [Condylostylus longicornis]|uniref:putative thiamine transporter SLC35F3 isoform X3 n=1 Tax=Condylostylus longicornis TaxID=2530218 RepID=UPI00244E43CB|nr:putative thiamine transporter SLC35F3 isoform X3 [Condylostylus longicornis]